MVDQPNSKDQELDACTASLPKSLWASTAVPPPDAPSLNRAVSCDAVIVGAGFTGLRAALALAEDHAQVAVLEAAEIGWGASGRTGGQVNPLLPTHQPEEVEAQLGPDAAARLIGATVGSADELFAFIERYQIPCDAVQKGWVRVAHCQSAARKFEQQCRSWIRAGAGIAFLESNEIAETVGSDAYAFGALVESGGSIQPLSYVRGLARAAAQAGAQVFSRSPVTALARKNGAWHLRTPGGEVTADKVLLCTNGYTDRLWPKLGRSIVPVTSVQIASEPLPESIGKSILAEGRTFADTRRLIYYGRRDREERFLLGSLGHGPDSAELDYQRVKAEALRLFPQLAGIKWTHQWNGRIAITRDHLPHLHEPAPGLLIGLGYNGRGVAMSNVMGRALAERALGAEASSLPFPITPITGYPFHGFKDLGVGVALRWMKLRDGLEMSRQ
ncbi:MAG: FAD-binding oxidoreductase [Pseudomonadota bacterium]